MKGFPGLNWAYYFSLAGKEQDMAQNLNIKKFQLLLESPGNSIYFSFLKR